MKAFGRGDSLTASVRVTVIDAHDGESYVVGRSAADVRFATFELVHERLRETLAYHHVKKVGCYVRETFI